MPFPRHRPGAQPHRSNSPAANGYTAALIPDPRNDVHAIAAQVTMLFHLLHNRTVDHLEAALGALDGIGRDQKSYRLYFVARFLCERAYRDIVRDDLLRRLLHPEVYELYSLPSTAFLDPAPLDAVPIEFAHVFRFGHAMARPFYVMNGLKPDGEELVDMLLTTSAGRPWRMPLDETWMIQWSHFFDLEGGTRPNLSRRIGPEISAGLFSSEVFGAVDATGAVGLPYRDLLSSALTGLWSVAALAAEIGRRRPELARLSPMLVDDERRAAGLRDWMRLHQEATGLTDADIAQLASDPPLFLYVLFEAAQEMEGRRLGLLGSLVVAEVLFKALRDAGSEAAASSFADVATLAFGGSDLAAGIARCAPAVRTMPELVAWLQAEPVGGDAAVPFV